MKNQNSPLNDITHTKRRLRTVLNRLVKKAHRVGCCLSPTLVDSILKDLHWGNLESMENFLDMLKEVDRKGFPDRGVAERLKGLLEFLLCPYFTARLEGKP